MKSIHWLGAALLAVAPLAPAMAEPLEVFGNRLFLPVTVNGEASTALLDSGAEMTILDDDFAAKLGLASTGSATAHGSGANQMEASFAEDVAVDAAGVKLNQKVAILDLDEVSSRLIGRPVPMILGRELFDRARFRIDLEGGSIALADAAPATGEPLPVTDQRGIPTIPAAIEGHELVQAAFDLGNGSDVMVGRAYAEKIGLTSHGRIVERRSGGGLGGAVDRDIVRLKSLTLAGRTFHDVPAAIDPGETATDLNIGTSILKHFLITTDFAGRSVWLEPRE